MSRIKTLLAYAASVLFGSTTRHEESVYNVPQLSGTTPEPKSTEAPKPTRPTTNTDTRRLTQFTINGHKVMAYSRKDAITRLKHQKLI